MVAGRQRLASMSRRVYVYDAKGEALWQSRPSQHRQRHRVVWCGPATARATTVSFFDARSGEVVQKLEWKGSLESWSQPGRRHRGVQSQDNSVHFASLDGARLDDARYPGKPSKLAFDTGHAPCDRRRKTVTVWNFRETVPKAPDQESTGPRLDPRLRCVPWHTTGLGARMVRWPCGV